MFASTLINNCLKMVWIVFVLLNIVRLINADIDIYSGTCGSSFDADNYKSVIVNFKGSDALYHDPCSIEFTKASYKQILCVSGEEIHLECGTKLEYHEGFVKNYISPEIEMSCGSVTLAEWCPSQYQDNIFIVIRKTIKAQTSDDIKLHVYLKDAPEDDYGSSFSSSPSLVIIVAPIAVLLLITVIVVVICIRARQGPRPQVMYQTTSGAVSMQTGPAAGGYQPQPQQNITGPQGNYNVHPMQTAYPVNQGSHPVNQPIFSEDTNTAGSSANRGLNATAPALEKNAPPPSYESVIGATHYL